jgi:hypothetical protein
VVNNCVEEGAIVIVAADLDTVHLPVVIEYAEV